MEAEQHKNLKEMQHIPKRTKLLAGRTSRSSPLKGGTPVKRGINLGGTHGEIINAFKKPAQTGPLGVEYESFVDKNGTKFTSLRKLEAVKRNGKKRNGKETI